MNDQALLTLPADADAARATAIASFRALPFPNTRDEEWRFTSLRPLWNQSFGAVPGNERAAAALIADLDLSETEGRRIVFVNGQFNTTLTDLSDLPAGVVVRELTEADSALVGQADTFTGDYFAALNSAYYASGILIHAPKNTVSAQPIAIYHLVTDSGALALPRVLYIGESFSELSIIEVFAGVDDAVYLHVPFTEVLLKDEARVHHFRVQKDGNAGLHINRTASKIGRSSDLQSFTISVGARLFRNDVRVALDGEAAHATIDGLVLVHENQLSDTHSVLDHRKPNCTSHQLHKCIVDGVGTSVFNGKIFVRQIAQKTDSYQANHNLQLSHHGMVYTKPQLEIFADDVKCSHGATVGQIDDEQLFYLKSRGLSEQQTRYLLTYGFAAQIVNALPVGSLRDRLTAEVDHFTRKRYEIETA
jgi:Fe-S cluster assembly protein SufD